MLIIGPWQEYKLAQLAESLQNTQKDQSNDSKNLSQDTHRRGIRHGVASRTCNSINQRSEEAHASCKEKKARHRVGRTNSGIALFSAGTREERKNASKRREGSNLVTQKRTTLKTNSTISNYTTETSLPSKKTSKVETRRSKTKLGKNQNTNPRSQNHNKESSLAFKKNSLPQDAANRDASDENSLQSSNASSNLEPYLKWQRGGKISRTSKNYGKKRRTQKKSNIGIFQNWLSAPQLNTSLSASHTEERLENGGDTASAIAQGEKASPFSLCLHEYDLTEESKQILGTHREKAVSPQHLLREHFGRSPHHTSEDISEEQWDEYLAL